ncbi:MAG: amino acid ABC transporter substrate-binding protein, partial [Pseudomonadota bacterium]
DQVWINYVNNWIKVKEAKGFFDATKEKWGL